MPTDQYLTEEQAVVFGRFVGEPSQAELEQFFYLDSTDLEGIAERRDDQNRLGFALQVGSVRFLGAFPGSRTKARVSHAKHLVEKRSFDDIPNPSTTRRRNHVGNPCRKSTSSNQVAPVLSTHVDRIRAGLHRGLKS
uniref:DUF4158 domain-containing protein n=1 Tax=Arthrobacter sp. TaxID=1667 RepID=UPI0020D20F66|nr:DUF4158 domain-containing protein [Arthrobacter sp.]